MPPAARDPKALADWMELDYHTRPRWFRRWCRKATFYTGFGLFVLLGASVVASIKYGYTSKLYQSGPVSPAHVAFNNDCGQCHTESFRTALRFSPVHSKIHPVPDAACQQCHTADPAFPPTGSRPGPIAPTHNKVLIDEPNCADCHREHRGQLVLARVADGFCTDCHDNLKVHRSQGESVFEKVTGFPNGHPQFSLWRGDHKGLKNGKDDPGQIHFNHKKHLALDDPRFLQGGSKLTCNQCHTPDESGRYMQPINHVTHCQRCHEEQRSAQLLGLFADPKDQKAAYDFSKELVPHAQPQVIRDSLNGRLRAFLGTNPVDIGKEDDLQRPVPWNKDEFVWKHYDGVLPSFVARRFTDPQLPHLEKQLFDKAGGCAFCHIAKPPTWKERERPVDILPEYEPPMIPKRWLRHGAFNHQRHLMVDCSRCHEAEKSSLTSDVLIPKQEVCASCHAPGGGARFDCAECHKYHGREDDRAAAHTFLLQGARK